MRNILIIFLILFTNLYSFEWKVKNDLGKENKLIFSVNQEWNPNASDRLENPWPKEYNALDKSSIKYKPLGDSSLIAHLLVTPALVEIYLNPSTL